MSSPPKIKRCPHCGVTHRTGAVDWAIVDDAPEFIAVFCYIDEGGCGMSGPAAPRRRLPSLDDDLRVAADAIAAWNALRGPGRPGRKAWRRQMERLLGEYATYITVAALDPQTPNGAQTAARLTRDAILALGPRPGRPGRKAWPEAPADDAREGATEDADG